MISISFRPCLPALAHQMLSFFSTLDHIDQSVVVLQECDLHPTVCLSCSHVSASRIIPAIVLQEPTITSRHLEAPKPYSQSAEMLSMTSLNFQKHVHSMCYPWSTICTLDQALMSLRCRA